MSYLSENASVTASATSLVIEVYRSSWPPSSSASLTSSFSRSSPDSFWIFSYTFSALLGPLSLAPTEGDDPQPATRVSAPAAAIPAMTRVARVVRICLSVLVPCMSSELDD